MKKQAKNFFLIVFIILFAASFCFYILLYISNGGKSSVELNIIDVDILNSLSIAISYLSLAMGVVFEIISRKIKYSFSFSKLERLILAALILNFVICIIFIEKYGSDINNFAKAQTAMSLILSFAGISASKSVGIESK